MHPHLTTHQDKSTLWVRIHNPPVNYLTTEVIEQLHDLLRTVRHDDSVRVVVLTGGLEDYFLTHFSIPELERISEDNERTGMATVVKTALGRALTEAAVAVDMGLMDRVKALERVQIKLAKSGGAATRTLHLWLAMHRFYRALERMNKITVAAINGPVAGGGMELSVCCDFRFMVGDQGFLMGQPEVLIGIIPGGGCSQRLPRLLGRARALDWMIRCHPLTPHQARDWGLVTDVFPKAVFEDKVAEFCDLVARRPPVAVEAVKRAVDRGTNTSLAHGLAIEMIQSIRCFATEDAKKAMKNYVRLIKDKVEVDPARRIPFEQLFETLYKAEFVDRFRGR